MKPVLRREIVRNYGLLWKRRNAVTARRVGLSLRIADVHRGITRRWDVQYSCCGLHFLLQHLGWHLDHERLYRQYWKENLWTPARVTIRLCECRYRSGLSEADRMKVVPVNPWTPIVQSTMASRIHVKSAFRRKILSDVTVMHSLTREVLVISAGSNFQTFLHHG